MAIENVDLILRVITIGLLMTLGFYWKLSEKGTTAGKQENKSESAFLEKILIYTTEFFVVLNVLGLTIFRFQNLMIKLIGILLVIGGSIIAIAGRAALGKNWTQCYQYQIKKNHQLIQNGIYAHIRHPIYGGILLGITGSLMVAGTYIFIPVFILAFYILRSFARREEKLLIKGFGKKYADYMKKTKMLIPFVY